MLFSLLSPWEALLYFSCILLIFLDFFWWINMFCFYPSQKEEEDIKLIFEKLILGRFTYCTKKKNSYTNTLLTCLSVDFVSSTLQGRNILLESILWNNNMNTLFKV